MKAKAPLVMFATEENHHARPRSSGRQQRDIDPRARLRPFILQSLPLRLLKPAR